MTSKETGFYSLIEDKTGDFAGREWLFSEIKFWLNNPNSPRFFLITGKAGTGKSALSARLWQISEGQVKDKNLEKGFLDAIYVCSSRESQSRDPIFFTESLATQLSNRYADFAKGSAIEYTKRVEINAHMTNIQAGGNVTGATLNIDVGSDPNIIFDKKVRDPLQIIIQKNPNKRIVFLIDALDESFTEGDSNSIPSLIADLKTLSRDVRFIVTSRDNDYIKQRLSRDGKVLSFSEEYYKKNNEDILKYINFKIKNETKLGNHYDGFVQDLTRKAEDNFLYVTFVLNAIVDGKLELRKESLDRIPPLLDGLYYEFLSRIKYNDPEKWNSELEIILAVLSVVYKSINLTQLAFLTGINPLKIKDDLLKLKSFIRFTGNKDQTSFDPEYRLYHQSLIDFLFQQKYRSKREDGTEYTEDNVFYYPKQEVHRTIAAKYYPPPTNDFDLNRLDEYGSRYLSYHVSELVDYKDYGGINWYEKLLQLANDDTFEKRQLEFLPLETELNIKIKKQALISALERNDSISIIEMLFVYVAKLTKLRKESPLDVLKNISYREGDEEYNDRILRKSWMVADFYNPEMSCLWYLIISWVLDNRNREAGAKNTLDRLNQKGPNALIFPDSMTSFLLYSLFEKYDQISNILKYATSENIHRVCELFIRDKKEALALEISTHIKDVAIKSEALSKIAPALVSTDVEGALSVADRIVEPFEKSEALSKMAEALVSTDVEGALSLANKIKNNLDKSKALSKMAEALVSTDVEGALSLANKIKNNLDKSEALSKMAEALVSTDVEGALSVANKIDDYYEKSKALSKMAEALVSTDVEGALSVANKIKNRYYKSTALSKIAPALVSIDITGALSVANKIEEPSEKSYVLSKIAGAYVSTNRDIAEKLLSQALSEVDKIKNPNNKSRALSGMAESMITTNRDIAEKLLSQALSEVDKIKNPSEKSYALFNISQVLFSTDSDSAEKLLSQALSEVDKIKNNFDKSEALSKMAEALVSTDVERALSVADRIVEPFEKSEALSKMASGLMYTDLEGALCVANKIKNRYYKSSALSKLDEALVSIDRDKAEKILAEAVSIIGTTDALIDKSSALREIAEALVYSDAEGALSVANKIEEPSEKSYVLSKIAGAYVSTNRDKAEKLFAEAVSTTDKIKDPYNKSYALTNIAKDLVSRDVEAALSLVDKITNPSEKSYALFEISQVLVSIDRDKAIKFLSQAFSIAKKIKDQDNTSFAPSRIAKDLVSRDVEAALSLVDKITNPSEKSYALFEISQVLVSIDRDKAKKLFEQSLSINSDARLDKTVALREIAIAIVSRDVERALSVADKIKDPYYKSYALSTIAESLITTNSDKAKKLLSEAVSTADKIKKTYYKSYALSTIAESLVPTDLKGALSITDKLKDPYHKSRVLSKIAEALISTDLKGALSITSKMRDPLDLEKSRVLSKIAEALISTDLKGALSVADKIKDPEYKSYALSKIAESLVPTDLKGALSVVDKTDPIEKSRVLSKIAEALISTDLKGALSVADMIIDRHDKMNVLSKIAESLVPTDVERALSVADMIIDRHDKMNVLSKMAGVIITTDRGKAEVLLGQALSIADRIEDPLDKSEELFKIVSMMIDSKLSSSRIASIIDLITDIDKLYQIARLKIPNQVEIDIIKRIMNYPRMTYSICVLICLRNLKQSMAIVNTMMAYTP